MHYCRRLRELEMLSPTAGLAGTAKLDAQAHAGLLGERRPWFALLGPRLWAQLLRVVGPRLRGALQRVLSDRDEHSVRIHPDLVVLVGSDQR